MKKVYDVRWSETSEKDLIGIIQHIAEDSPTVIRSPEELRNYL